MDKKSLWEKIIKIIIYALSLFGGSFIGSSCTQQIEISNVASAPADTTSINLLTPFE